MTFNALLVASATILQITGYISYNRGVANRTITPNISSWLIWGTISLISCTSYISLSNQNISVSIMPIVVTIIDIATFVSILRRGTFQSITHFDRGSLVLSLASLITWAFIDSAQAANILVQAALLIGTLPTIHGAYLNPSYESPAPWFVWSCGFLVATIIVALQDIHWVAYLSPLLQLAMYLTIGTLALRATKNATA